MNILLLHPESEQLSTIAFYLETKLNVDVHKTSDFSQALEWLLSDEIFDLIITCAHPLTEKFFKFLLSTNTLTPIVLIQAHDLNIPEAFPDLHVLSIIDPKTVPEILPKILKERFGSVDKNTEAASKYARIGTDLLVKVVPLKSDIYIRLSNLKYIRIFRAGATFKEEDLDKFLVRKKIDYLYILKEEAEEFLEKIQANLLKQIETAKIDEAGLQDTVASVQEIVREFSKKLGFTPAIQEIAKENVKLALKMIGASPKLSMALAHSQMASKNYISAHSVQVAQVACSIAAQMEWPSTTTFQKLTFAALFHDITISSPDLARAYSTADIEKAKVDFGEATSQMIRNHPIKGAELVNAMNEVPGDVATIIIQHHERPDGSGFPKGLQAHKISPLAAVFIVAHDIVNDLQFKKEKFSLLEFIKIKEPEYLLGTFKKVLKILDPSTASVSKS